MAFIMGTYPNSSPIKLQNNLKFFFLSILSPSYSSSKFPRNRNASSNLIAQNHVVTSTETPLSNSSAQNNNQSPFQGLEDLMAGYIFGKKKATQVAQAVWKNVVRKGDRVIDATCGNGYDTLAMLRLVADDTRRGRVYAMDLQKDAIESTSSLLEQSVNVDERELVELYSMCHTKMEELIPYGDSVRLVAFNLGYLPGGDKKIKTESETTLLALEAAGRIVGRGGLISIVAYVGHSGGREEFEIVQSFAAGLAVENWVCCKLQMLNRPFAPVLVLLYKK